jgi:transcriptional regulator with XRE-family HTH domain
MGDRTARIGSGLRALLHDKNMSSEALANQADISIDRVGAYLDGSSGEPRFGELAAMCVAFGLDPLDFLHRTGFITDVDYAMGLDPLFFLVEGGVRSMMRIALRERHNNPRPIEGENVIRRNSVIRALQDDTMIDPASSIEMQMRYLLAAAKNSGWTDDLPQ